MKKENIKKVLKNIGNFISDVFKKTLKLIKKISNKNVRKYIGISLLTLAIIFMIIETIVVLLFGIDPAQLSKILAYSFRFDLFQYINLKEFYLILSGGYILDMLFFGLVLALAKVIWCGKNIFSMKKIRILFLSLFTIGLTLFSFGMYYALPEIKEPMRIIHDQMCFHHQYEKMHKKDQYEHKQDEMYFKGNYYNTKKDIENLEKGFHSQIFYYLNDR